MCVFPIYPADIYYAALIVFIFTFLPWQPSCVIVCESCSELLCQLHLALTTSVFTSRKGLSSVVRALQPIQTCRVFDGPSGWFWNAIPAFKEKGNSDTVNHFQCAHSGWSRDTGGKSEPKISQSVMWS